MTTWFVTRHPGAIAWAARRGLVVDHCIAHFDPEIVAPGDTVIGVLPVNFAARVCARGGRYFNLSLDLPPEARGRELSADELDGYGARIERYVVCSMQEPVVRQRHSAEKREFSNSRKSPDPQGGEP